MRTRRVRRVTPGRFEDFGDAAVRFSAPDARSATALAEAVRAEGLGGITDAVGGADSVLVAFDPEVTSSTAVADGLRSLRALVRPREATTHTVAVSLDGPDVEEVARLSGLGRDGVRRALLARTLEVAFLGFAPGFAYLDGLASPLHRVPRRATPRPAVPAGSLALGGGRAAIYPRATPGGWQVVGRTAITLFDPEQPPYALLAPGDRVRLREVGPDEIEPVPGPRPPAVPRGPAVFSVEAAGLYTTFQDPGRPGLAHLGVSGSGAADRVSFLLANRLLGNPPEAACIEITGAGPTLVCGHATFVAVVGGQPEVALDGRPVGAGRVVPVAPGQRLVIGSTGWSARSYLAVRGGFDAPVTLGSRSTDRLGGLGPAPLAAGDRLVVGPAAGAMADHLVPGSPGQQAWGYELTVRALPVGPSRPWRDALFGRRYEVDATSDRVGIRLRPLGGPLEPAAEAVSSVGVTAGTVQVPPSGEPLVLSADHATHGGYPVAAVVIAADLAVLGRCRPGEQIRLVAVGPDEAAAALGALRRGVQSGPVGTYPTAAG